jgi:hypothetical protein
MAEKKGKTLPAEPEIEKPGAEPESEPNTEPIPEPPVIPERFRGKKPEDLIKMYEEAEKEKDRLGTEVGKLRGETDEYRNNLAYYQNLAQDLQSRSEQGGGQPASEPKVDLTGFYDNPLPSIEQVFDKKFKEYEERKGKAEQEREDQRASMNFATGRGKAMQSNPGLFQGVERQVENGMWQYYKSGRITADELRDPESWENGARIAHVANKDYERVVPPKVVPVSSTPTEKPGAVKKELPEEGVPNIELDDFGKELLAHRPADMSEKDFLKLVQETKKREGR